MLFLYREVLNIELDDSINTVRAKRPKRLPVVLTKEEVRQVTDAMSGTHQLMAKLLYGSGLRLMECLRPRVKDIDFEQNQIFVRDGKGMNNLVTVLPDSLKVPLQEHLNRVNSFYHRKQMEFISSAIR